MKNKLNNMAEYRINLCKSIASLYTNNKCTDKEIVDTFPFTIASKNIKYLRIYPT